MELVRSESPDLASRIAPAKARASRNGHALGSACTANLFALSTAVAVSLAFSARTGVRLSVPVLVALNGFVLWRARASQRRWVVVGCADRLYVRLFAPHIGEGDSRDQDVLVLEASEIASLSIRTVAVFLQGPKPKLVESLIIEPGQTVAEDVSKCVAPLLASTGREGALLAGHENGRLTIEWKWWRPALRVFLAEMARECPSVAIGPEERSELDLNGIWTKPDAEQRHMLVRAKRLGFDCECAGLLAKHRHVSFQESTSLLAEIEQEEVGTGDFGVQR